MTQTTFMARLGLAATIAIMVLLGFAAYRESDRQQTAADERQQAALTEAVDLYAVYCAECHGAFGEGLSLNPALNNDALRRQAHDFIFDTIARGRTYTDMMGFSYHENGPLTDAQIENLVLLIQRAPWQRVGQRVAALGLTPDEDALQTVNLDELPYSIDDIQAGRQLYLTNCASCHGGGSTAVQGNLIGKPLVNNDYVQNHSDEDLLLFIKQGRGVDHPENVTGYEMPPSAAIPP